MAVTNRLRFEIFRRDGFRCRYCGASAEEKAVLEIDHVLPTVLGGSDKPSNLVTACDKCNSGKGSAHPDSPAIDDDVDADAERWWKARRRIAQKIAEAGNAQASACAAFEETWKRWTWRDGDEQRPVHLPDDWSDVVSELVLMGLPTWMLQECAEEAMRVRSLRQADRFNWMRRRAIERIRWLQEAIDRDLKEGDEARAVVIGAARDHLALQLLGHFSQEERVQAYKDDQDVSGASDTETGAAVGALWWAIRNLLMDRACIEGTLRTLLEALPDGIGETSAARARLILGPDHEDDPHRLLSHAAAVAAEEFNLRAATAYLETLSSTEREKWLEHARYEHSEHDWAMDEASYIVEAARFAQEFHTATNACEPEVAH